MSNPPDHPISPGALRERAEAALRTSWADVARMSPDEIQMLIHEFQVHQIELKLQNEELREAQAALAQSRDRFNDLYDFAPVGYVTLDPRGAVLEANLTAATLLGSARHALIGRPLARFVARESQDTLHLHRQAVRPGAGNETCELLVQRPDGNLLSIRLDSIGFTDPLTRACHCRTVLSDITVQKQAAEALQASDAFRRAILNSLPASIAVLDPTGRIIAVNDPWLRFAEQNGQPETARVAEGANYLDACRRGVRQGDPYAQAALDGVAAVLSGQRSLFHLEYPCDAPDRKRWFLLMAVRPSAPIGGAIITHTEVTARKVAEEALARSHAELERRVAERTAEVEHAHRSLRESEERFRGIFEHAAMGIAIATLDGRLVQCNPAHCTITGYSEEELSRREFPELVHPEDRAENLALFERLRTGDLPLFTIEHRFLRKDGSEVWVHKCVSALRDETGKPTHFIALVTDITERRRAEQALRGSEQRARDLIEALPAAVYTTDAAGRITLYNRAAVDLWGGEPKLGRDLWCGSWRLFWPDGRPMAHEDSPMARAIKSNLPVRGEEAIAERTDGTRVSFIPYPTPLRDAAGLLIGAVNMLVDISTRKHAEQRLDEANERLRALLQALPVGVSFSDDARCERVSGNAVLRAQFEVTEEDNASASAADPSAAGRQIRYVQAGRSLRGDELPLQRAAAENRLISAEEFDVELPSGRRWIMEASGAPVRDAAGAVIGAIAVTVDVTARKRAEEALEDSRARLAGIVGSAMDAIITIDAGQRIVLFNAAAERMFGCRAVEALGSSIERFIPAYFREHPEQRMRSFGDPGATGTFGALRADGTEFPIEASIAQIEVSGSKLSTVILRDVTERQRSETGVKLRARQQQATADLSQHALTGRDLEWLLNDAVVLVAQVLEIEYCNVLELLPGGAELLLRAGAGWAEGSVGVRRVGAGALSPAGYALQQGEPVVAEDLASETRFRNPALLAEHGVTSSMVVIIHGRGQPYGVLGADTRQRRHFSGDDVHFLQSIADVLAAAIERRDLEEELLAAANREQQRIGQDLHDGLCQHLAGVEFRTEALARDLIGQPGAQREAAKICALMREGTRLARMLARGLVPVELEANGLMAALTELARSTTDLYRIACRFVCDRPVLITEHQTASHLYRIAQEAVGNALRHAHARSVVIELRPQNGGAVLTVTNDGHPLPADAHRSSGMGLRTMRYRAEMIGARLRLAATEAGETVLSCAFDLRSPP